jgi:vesicle transport through interaction with t-SNAREs protein 1
MSNPLDSDPGSELFAGYEADLKLVQANLNQQFDQIPDLLGEPRKAAIGNAERALDEASEIVCRFRLSCSKYFRMSAQKRAARTRYSNTCK